MTIESITGKDLGEVLQTINPNSMSHSDEIVAQSLVDASMAGNSFITADYALWTKGTEEDGSASHCERLRHQEKRVPRSSRVRRRKKA